MEEQLKEEQLKEEQLKVLIDFVCSYKARLTDVQVAKAEDIYGNFNDSDALPALKLVGLSMLVSEYITETIKSSTVLMRGVRYFGKAYLVAETEKIYAVNRAMIACLKVLGECAIETGDENDFYGALIAMGKYISLRTDKAVAEIKRAADRFEVMESKR